MNAELLRLPVGERIQLVEDLWDSIAQDQATLSLSDEQREELDRRIEAYETDGQRGRLADAVIADLRTRI